MSPLAQAGRLQPEDPDEVLFHRLFGGFDDPAGLPAVDKDDERRELDDLPAVEIRGPFVFGLRDGEVRGLDQGGIDEVEDLEISADVGHAVRAPAAEKDLDADLAAKPAKLLEGLRLGLAGRDQVLPGWAVLEDGFAGDGAGKVLSGRERGKKGERDKNDDKNKRRLAHGSAARAAQSLVFDELGDQGQRLDPGAAGDVDDLHDLSKGELGQGADEDGLVLAGAVDAAELFEEAAELVRRAVDLDDVVRPAGSGR